MNNYLIVSHNIHLNEKLSYSAAMVALELDDLAQLIMLLDGSIALEPLPQRLTYLLEIQIAVETSDGENTLASVALPHSQMNLIA